MLSETQLVDGHNDLPWAMRLVAGYDFGAVDLEAGTTSTHTDIPRLRRGRVGAQFWSVYVPSSLPGDTAVTATLEQIDFVLQLVRRFPDVFELARSTDEVTRAFAAGRIASLIGAEGGQSIACSLGALRALYELGVRYLTLTHNDNVPWADSATDAVGVGGLAPFGRVVVTEMNRLGMIVDLSHVAASTMGDALDTTVAPVVFSHSSCRALVDHPRNVPDDILSRLAGNGGVCMVAFVPEFVSDDCRRWRLEVRERSEGESAAVPRPEATIADVCDHIEHVREVAGIDHVGVGGDYDGTDWFPVGLEDTSGYPALFASLLDRGWSEQECAKVAGTNVLRAFGDVEAVARALQAATEPSVERFVSEEASAGVGP